MYLSSKWSQKLGVLKRLKDKVPKEMLDIVSKTIIQPHIDYCITVWGYGPDVHIDKIQRTYTVQGGTPDVWCIWLECKRHRYNVV